MFHVLLPVIPCCSYIYGQPRIASKPAIESGMCWRLFPYFFRTFLLYEVLRALSKENWIYATLLCDDLLAVPDIDSLGGRSGEAAAGKVVVCWNGLDVGFN